MVWAKLTEGLGESLRRAGWLMDERLGRLELAVPRDPAHGDWTTNLALLLARELSMPPRAVAEKLAAGFSADPSTWSSVDVAGPGFLNFSYSDAFLRGLPARVLAGGETFGHWPHDPGTRIQVEYVSANPTGPLNVVNGRAAAVGAALVRLFEATGHRAEGEFYVNDTGAQVEVFGESLAARFAERAGIALALPENGYQGEYLRDLARELPLAEAKRALGEPGGSAWFRDRGLRLMLERQRRDLDEYGAVFSNWFGESTLHRSGAVARTLEALEERGVVPLKAALEALGLEPDFLEVIIVQQVNLLSGGEPVKMSKRAGEFITLRDLMDEVGADCAKFFFLLRSTSAHLDFDLDLAKQQNDENPTYYVQYAHARIASILRFASERGLEPARGPIPVEAAEERALLRKLAAFPEVVRGAAVAREPHRLPAYLMETAALFHRFYHVCRVVSEDRERSRARIAIVDATRIVLRNGLGLMGVTSPERMERDAESVA